MYRQNKNSIIFITLLCSQIENYLYTLNLENGYIQDLGKHEEEYVPDF